MWAQKKANYSHVGSASEIEVHRTVVENIADLQSGQVAEAGNSTVFRWNGARGGIGMKEQVPEVLDKMVDAVLAYRPKPKSKAAKKRARKAKKKAKG